jgi:uncharacterized protein (TIGR03435 family)
MPVYQLVLAKGGSKLKEAADPAKHQFGIGSSTIRGSLAIHDLIGILESMPDIGGREVIDKTGLTGTYDLLLKWAPMEAASTPGGQSGTTPSPDAESTSLFTAIEEQLGLKLVSAKAPVDVLVVEHIERPSDN